MHRYWLTAASFSEQRLVARSLPKLIQDPYGVPSPERFFIEWLN